MESLEMAAGNRRKPSRNYECRACSSRDWRPREIARRDLPLRSGYVHAKNAYSSKSHPKMHKAINIITDIAHSLSSPRSRAIDKKSLPLRTQESPENFMRKLLRSSPQFHHCCRSPDSLLWFPNK